MKTPVSSSAPDLDMLRSWACWSAPCPAVRTCNVRPPQKERRRSLRLSATLFVDTVFVINTGYRFALGVPMGIKSESRGTEVLLPLPAFTSSRVTSYCSVFSSMLNQPATLAAWRTWRRRATTQAMTTQDTIPARPPNCTCDSGQKTLANDANMPTQTTRSTIVRRRRTAGSFQPRRNATELSAFSPPPSANGRTVCN